MTANAKDKAYHYPLLEENRRKAVEQAAELNKTIQDLSSVAPPLPEFDQDPFVKLPAFSAVNYNLMHALEETEQERVVWMAKHQKRKTA